MARSPARSSPVLRGPGGKTGLAPGTMVFIGEQKRDRLRIDAIDYDAARVEEVCDLPVGDCSSFLQAASVTWLNINGIHDVELIEDLGACFGLHPMTLEDIVNTTQRPKFEEFPDYLFATLKMLAFDPLTSRVAIEHVSLILGETFVISFLEDEGDVFDGVRHRIRTGSGRVRRLKADYLAYSLMDAVVDHYFLAIEQLGDRIEEFDDRILEDPRPGDMKEIHRLKRGVLGLRKAVWPFREEISAIEKSDSPLLRPETKVFWRDLYDHTIQIIDMVETYRDILGGMHDTYLSSLSNRMNEVMKVLTIISTIFIPLTFIVGVYGMNFEHMPELRWRLGYYGVWTIMLVVALSLFGYFKRKRWL